MLDIYRGSWKF